jgi:hypothetical protein
MLRADLAGADAMLAGPSRRPAGRTGWRIAGGTSQVQRNIIGERCSASHENPSATSRRHEPTHDMSGAAT